MHLSQTLLGISFSNPTVLTAGPWGWTAADLFAVAESGAGAVTTKSMRANEHAGNHEPTVVTTPFYSLNAVGLPYGGAEMAKKEVGAYMAKHPVPFIANIVGMTAQDFVEIARVVVPLKPDVLEVNLSSPTFLKLRGSFLTENTQEFQEIITSVKKEAGDIPVFVKLSPNVPNIGEIAKACVDAGADGLTAINTIGPGMAIDVETRMPILSAWKGGMSGRGAKSIAVRCIADIYAATEGKIPLIGVGGMTTGADAVEMLLAGASLVGIGTAIWERGTEVFRLVCEELSAWCDAHGVKNVSELTGGLHREIALQGKQYK